MTIRIADCYFWIQAYYILLGHEIGAGLFKTGSCHICKKEAVYDSQKKNTTRRITVCCTETSENMIKKLAGLKTEVLYRQVQCDLIVKEFSNHNYYYNLLTKPVYKDKECNADNYVDPESHFSAAVNFILINVLKNYQTVSMKTLTSLYSVKQGNDRRYRHKLKMKLKNRYWFFQFVIY